MYAGFRKTVIRVSSTGGVVPLIELIELPSAAVWLYATATSSNSNLTALWTLHSSLQGFCTVTCHMMSVSARIRSHTTPTTHRQQTTPGDRSTTGWSGHASDAWCSRTKVLSHRSPLSHLFIGVPWLLLITRSSNLGAATSVGGWVGCSGPCKEQQGTPFTADNTGKDQD